MSLKPKGKKRNVKEAGESSDEVDLFSRLTTRDVGDALSDADSTDSEESVYSGLDEEENSDEAESFEEASDSMSEIDSEDDEADEEDGDSSNDDSDDTNSEQEEKFILDNKLGETKSGKSSKDVTNNNTSAVNKSNPSKNRSNMESKNRSNMESKKPDKRPVLKKKKIKEKLSDKPEADQNLETSNSPGGGTVLGPGTSNSPGGVTVQGPDEYEFDSSDEEDIRNTVGNIPMEWYKEYEHIGYNLLGQKLIKPPSGDQLDNFLNKMDNPDYWRTVVDKSTGQNVVISEKDAEIIKRLRRGKYVDSSYDPYQPWVDFFTYNKMLHPVTNQPAHKRSFTPSNWERIKVGRMVHAIKMGWMKPRTEKKTEDDDEPHYYHLWEADETPDITKRYRAQIPAPKLRLPGHEESYNPPPEYLPTEEEELAWKDQDPEDRRLNFLPKTFPSMRQVPGYNRFVNERFERCLDLYLCPRQRKLRMNVNPEDLLPKLPKPKDLQPFPTTQSVVYKGHTNLVRSISVESNGQYLVSGSDDETIRFWEVSTGRCMKTLAVGGVVRGVAWNPNTSLCLVAAIVEEDVLIINPQLGDKLVISNTDSLIQAYTEQETSKDNVLAEWEAYTDKEYDEGFRLRISHNKAPGQVTWHARGDYLAVVIPGGESKSVLIHQVARRRSQNPFRKSKGLVQCVKFHPTRPFLFVATQRYVRVYNLLKQELTKKLMTNVKWVSSMAVHPGGDNVIVGSYDCRLTWFDLDLSAKPYQTLRHHKKAIRQVCYHKKYPLFASASDDGTIIICHGRVYNDLLQNPLIVPVKVLRGHDVKHNLGILDCEFHPTQPWVFSSASDNTIRLFS